MIDLQQTRSIQIEGSITFSRSKEKPKFFVYGGCWGGQVQWHSHALLSVLICFFCWVVKGFFLVASCIDGERWFRSKREPQGLYIIRNINYHLSVGTFLHEKVQKRIFPITLIISSIGCTLPSDCFQYKRAHHEAKVVKHFGSCREWKYSRVFNRFFGLKPVYSWKITIFNVIGYLALLRSSEGGGYVLPHCKEQ